MTIGSLFDVFVIYFSKNMKNLYDDDDVEGDTTGAATTGTIMSSGGGPLQDTSQVKKDANDNDPQENYELQTSSSSPKSLVVSDGPQAASDVMGDGSEVESKSRVRPQPPAYEPVASETESSL